MSILKLAEIFELKCYAQNNKQIALTGQTINLMNDFNEDLNFIINVAGPDARKVYADQMSNFVNPWPLSAGMKMPSDIVKDFETVKQYLKQEISSKTTNLYIVVEMQKLIFEYHYPLRIEAKTYLHNKFTNMRKSINI